jgi:hypothetical protein
MQVVERVIDRPGNASRSPLAARITVMPRSFRRPSSAAALTLDVARADHGSIIMAPASWRRCNWESIRVWLAE